MEVVGWLGLKPEWTFALPKKGDIKKNMGRQLNGRPVTGQSNKSLQLCFKIKKKQNHMVLPFNCLN